MPKAGTESFVWIVRPTSHAFTLVDTSIDTKRTTLGFWQHSLPTLPFLCHFFWGGTNSQSLSFGGPYSQNNWYSALSQEGDCSCDLPCFPFPFWGVCSCSSGGSSLQSNGCSAGGDFTLFFLSLSFFGGTTTLFSWWTCFIRQLMLSSCLKKGIAVA